MTDVNTKPFPIPINYFGIVLGLSALSLAWHYAIPVWDFSLEINQVLFLLASALWVCFILAFLWKWICFPQQAKMDFQHKLLGSFVSLIPITTTLVGIGAMPYSLSFGYFLMAIGIVSQLTFATYYIAGMWRGTHQPEFTTPVIYLPTVATNFVSATALGYLGYNDFGMLFFGAGFFSWIMLEPSVLQRLRTLQPVPEPLRMGIGIQLAPAFVGCSAYLSVNGGQIDLFVKMLIGYGLLQLLFLIRLLPWIFVNGFTPSAWAFSFGLASMAKVGLFVYQNSIAPLFAKLGLVMFIFANFTIGLLFVATLYLIFSKRFFVK